MSISALDRPNSYIGRSVPRPNARRLLAGRGRFTDDLALPRMLHAAFLRSPHAHARIVAIDTTAARSMPGVVKVVTGRDLTAVCTPWVGVLDHFTGMRSPQQHPLAIDRVTWQGEPVAAVVAESRALAEDAVEAILAEYEELPPVTDPEAALASGSPLVHPELGTNLCFELELQAGTPGEAMAAAATVVERTMDFGRHTAVTLEPRGLIADWDPAEERLTVHSTTQTPYQMQDVYSRHFGIAEERVRVVSRDVGGAFGMKLHVYNDDMATVALAILLGRPVKFIADRFESFVSDIHARDHRVTARMGLDRDGRILAIEVDDMTGVGAYSVYPRTSVVEGNQVVRLIGGQYAFSDYAARLRVVFQNKNLMSQYRAVGHPIACAVTEALVDQAARELGIDPVAIRRRNLVADDAYPCRSATGFFFERLSHHACLDKLLALMDHDALRADQEEQRRAGVYRGIGLATFIEITNPGPEFYGVGGAHITSQDGCVLKLEPSGKLRCMVSVCEHGQGTETVMAQIAATAFGVAVDDVRVITGDTETTPYGGASWASRGTGIGGEAVLKAGKALRRNVLEIAAVLLQSDSGGLDIQGGMVVDTASGAERLPVAEVARIGYFRPDTLPRNVRAEFTVAEHYIPREQPFAFTNGIQAAWVEVDVETGFVRLLRHWVVEDCGRIINPRLVDEQIRGGVVQGLGAALLEHCVYDTAGQLLNATLADYLVPMASETPDIEVAHIQTPTAFSELGAKGVGEAGTAGASGAVLNAVNDALAPLGAGVWSLPITPETVLRALGRI